LVGAKGELAPPLRLPIVGAARAQSPRGPPPFVPPRSDLLTHVVRDTDVAAADPFESLPLGFRAAPGSRFAAPRPAPPPLPPRAPTPALASTAAGRRRGGSLGGSAAPSPGGAWGGGGPLGLGGLGGGVPLVDEDQGRADRALMDELEGERGQRAGAGPWDACGCSAAWA
jgi:hypothetical protein